MFLKNKLIIVVFLGLLILLSISIFSKDPERFSINLFETDVADVLRMIAEQYNLNIIISKGVEGKISLRLDNVLFEDALNVILEAGNCEMVKVGDVIKVVPKVAVEEAKKVKTIDEIFSPKFLSALDLKNNITPLLTKNGVINIFTRSTTGERDVIIISDTPDKIEEIRKIIEQLDTEPGQVLIESKMLETSLDKVSNLGIDWNIDAELKGSAKEIGFPFEGKKASGFSFGRLSYEQLRAVLSALETQGNTNIISNAKIATVNGKVANILVGSQVPIKTFERAKETGNWGITGYQTQEVGVQLDVTPKIIDDKLIAMEIHPEVSEITGWVKDEIGGTPILDTREVTTNVIVDDGETIVIGGLLKESEIEGVRKVPFLGDLPILGNLFKKKSLRKEKTDLLIFITANIIKKKPEITQPPVETEKEKTEKELEKFLELKKP